MHAITPGRRPSGARLYHRNSRFGEPERRRLDRAHVWKIMACAEALERRTRGKGQHGGLLKAKGLDVLRALLRRFYSYTNGTCFPSYREIAETAGCCVETVRQKLRALEEVGIIETIRRKAVVSYSNRAHRVRFDVPEQTSNSYVFNFAVVDRPAHGDLALPLLREPAVSPNAKLSHETSLGVFSKEAAELEAAIAGWRHALEAREAADRTAERGGRR